MLHLTGGVYSMSMSKTTRDFIFTTVFLLCAVGIFVGFVVILVNANNEAKANSQKQCEKIAKMVNTSTYYVNYHDCFILNGKTIEKVDL